MSTSTISSIPMNRKVYPGWIHVLCISNNEPMEENARLSADHAYPLVMTFKSNRQLNQ